MTEQEKIRLAELEVAQARAGQSKAELERDVIANAAVSGIRATNNSVVEASMRANQAESQARSMATAASLARGEAASERASASNATFTAAISVILVIGLLAAIGGYYLWYVPSQPVVVVSPQKPDITINTPASSQATQPPPNININNRVINPVQATPKSKPEPKSKPDPTDTPVKPDPANTPADPTPTDTPAKPDPTETPKGDSNGQ